jgi:peptidoglycan/LPS O-acetylase OafA/YrhL
MKLPVPAHSTRDNIQHKNTPNLILMTASNSRESASLPYAYSLYLDLVRFMAAIMVLVNHVSEYPMSRNSRAVVHPVLNYLGEYGATAVTVFFVLSGYVIAYVASTRERTASAYTASRLSRLYSVVIPAIVITLACDSLGQWLQPNFYQIQKVLWKPASWAGYLSSVFFVNEYQVFHFNGIVPGTNAPFWSLSFEATYYLLAGLALFAPRRYALPAALLILGLAGRTVTVLLPLWAMGFWVYRARARLAQIVRAPGLLLVASAAIVIAIPQLELFTSWDNFGVTFPWGRKPFNRNLLLDYSTALAFAVHLVAAERVLFNVRFASLRIERTIRWLGSTTFPMYAIHRPVLCLAAALSPFARQSWSSIMFVTCVVLATVALMTPFCEWAKGMLRRTVFVSRTTGAVYR